MATLPNLLIRTRGPQTYKQLLSVLVGDLSVCVIIRWACSLHPRPLLMPTTPEKGKSTLLG